MAPPNLMSNGGYVPLQMQWAYADLLKGVLDTTEPAASPQPQSLTLGVNQGAPMIQYPGESIKVPVSTGADATGGNGGEGGGLTSVQAGLIGSGIKMLGQAYTAWTGLKTQAALSEAQAGMADVNAKIMELGVDIAYRRRDAEIGNLTLRAGQIKAQQRVAFASRGVALGVGSTAEVAASTELQKEVDVLTAEMNGLMSAWNYKRQAAMFRAQAAGARNAAKIYRHAAPVVGGLYAGSALASLVGGAMGG